MNLIVMLLMLVAAPTPRQDQVTAASSHAESTTATQSVHEVVVPAPPSAVWRAISTAEGWSNWAASKAWISGSVIETSYDPAGSPGASANNKSEIVLSVPERIFAFRTIKAPAGFADFDALAKVTWLFELRPDGAGTRVRLTGSGFPRTPAGRRVLAFFMRGNAIALKALRDSFATGTGQTRDSNGEREGCLRSIYLRCWSAA